jgi:ceramide glucosyltransferase
VWDRQLRWNRTRRAGFPGLFVLEVALGPLLSLASLAALAALGAAPLWTPALFVALWYGAEIGFARAIGLALSPRDLAAMLMRDALLPALWIATFVRRGFDWRGTAMGAAGEPAE